MMSLSKRIITLIHTYVVYHDNSLLKVNSTFYLFQGTNIEVVHDSLSKGFLRNVIAHRHPEIRFVIKVEMFVDFVKTSFPRRWRTDQENSRGSRRKDSLHD